MTKSRCSVPDRAACLCQRKATRVTEMAGGRGPGGGRGPKFAAPLLYMGAPAGWTDCVYTVR